MVLSLLKMDGPLLEGLVGGQDDRTPFIALADHLEEQIGSGWSMGK